MRRRIKNQKLFKRFSQITGIPLKNVYPIETKKVRFDAAGIYRPSTHTVGIRKKDMVYAQNFIREHEQRHGLHYLADQRYYSMLAKFILEREPKVIFWLTHPKLYFKALLELKKTFSRKRKLEEPTVTAGEGYMLIEPIRELGIVKIALAAGLPFLAFYLFPQYIAQVRRHVFIRELIQKHGEDGLLLLWVAPPKKQDALHVRAWEKKMVENCYLKEKGGLTKKGLKYWREHLQPQSIWQKLAEAEKERKKQKTT